MSVCTHWIEKYRPRRIADCVLLPSDREMFESFIAKGYAPHLLLIGPPGVGKTSTALALTNELGWKTKRKNAAAYLNVEAVRNEIACFASPGPIYHFFEGEMPHRCMILDESDHMSGPAQAALRAILEDAAESGECNFILIANNYEKIDPAIRSRCAIVNLSYSAKDDREVIMAGFRDRIGWIFEAEGLELSSPAIDCCLRNHGTDFRAALNDIQSRCI